MLYFTSVAVSSARRVVQILILVFDGCSFFYRQCAYGTPLTAFRKGTGKSLLKINLPLLKINLPVLIDAAVPSRQTDVSASCDEKEYLPLFSVRNQSLPQASSLRGQMCTALLFR